MRTQYCRTHIDKAAEECGLEEESVREVKVAADFADEHPEISDCSTDALRVLIREKDEEIRELAIFFICSAVRVAKEAGKENVSYTKKQVIEFLDRARKRVVKEREAEIERKEKVAAEVIKASEAVFPEAVALPPIGFKRIDVIEVKEMGECAAEEARNNPVEKLKKDDEDGRVAPQNSLKVSYGKQVVGEVKLPDMKEEKPLGQAAEDFAVLIKTSQDSIAALKVKDAEACALRAESVKNIDSLEKLLEPLRAQVREYEEQIKVEKSLIKRCDNERQRLGVTIIEQYDRIVELRKKQEAAL